MEVGRGDPKAKNRTRTLAVKGESGNVGMDAAAGSALGGFGYVSIEERIMASKPSAAADPDQALDRINPTFCELFAAQGRPSMPQEQLLLASLLQAFYGIRSERLLQEQLHYNLMFRWLGPDCDGSSCPSIRSSDPPSELNERLRRLPQLDDSRQLAYGIDRNSLDSRTDDQISAISSDFMGADGPLSWNSVVWLCLQP